MNEVSEGLVVHAVDRDSPTVAVCGRDFTYGLIVKDFPNELKGRLQIFTKCDECTRILEERKENERRDN